MVKAIFFRAAMYTFLLSVVVAVAHNEPSKSNALAGEYVLIVEGYDWGPAASRVVLSLDVTATEAMAGDYTVAVSRDTEYAEIAPEQASGKRTVIYAYVSDEEGNRLETGNHITLVLAVGPDVALASPIQYIRTDKGGRNLWIDYKLSITHTPSNTIWDKEAGRIRELVDSFDLSGTFKDSNGITMSYASFTPKTANEKSPLIIWLHGGGEGGTDPSIPIIANRAANYASDEIQSFFDGAYVLSPQCPGAWMHNGEGVTTHGREDDIYNKGLMELIRSYVMSNPKIDVDRIYVGGCSNGGYMALKLIMLHPDYFAAGYISALAYQSEYISDAQINAIKGVPIWFVHSKDDRTTIPEKTVVPVYERLIGAGAPNVHFSYYDHVTDITGFFGGNNYYYNGHWSWIYSHANRAKLDYDGTPVMYQNRPVTIMEWLAAQSN
ncbi:MAG: prolyl oligopeptidase family serine peptidase [Flavobacteriaceae bacterium]